MFSKIDKRVLSVLIIVLVLAGLAGFAGYKYVTRPETNVENKAGGVDAQVEDETMDDAKTSDQPTVSAPIMEFQADTNIGGGMLSVCKDECGNGVCQKANPECEKDSSKCICAEDPQVCPEDCK